MYVVQFGHIPMRLDVLFEGGQVRTLDSFDAEWMARGAHPDGFYYPPIVHTVREGLGSEPEVVPNSQRASLLHRLPPTHGLVLWHEEPSRDIDLRMGLAAFLVHLLGFLTGHRAQFADWWMDGRIQVRSNSDAEPLYQREVGAFLQRAMDRWWSFSDRDRRVLVNALFMHNRAPMYEWPWERFLVEYQVFDAIFRIAQRVDGVPDKGHAKRFENAVARYGLFDDPDLFRKMVDLRNDLVHETLWVGGMPTAGGGEDGFYSWIWLKNINQRFAMAVLGFAGPYIGSNWRSLLHHFLDLDQLRPSFALERRPPRASATS